ncbi:MAG TPA: Fic family protein [Candidatus Dormibacteraeota bacterium]|nr:Fic family protein [Candidatus Dormibacteraeota bacterium]
MSRLSLDVIDFCAVECRLQGSGEDSVGWMCRAWARARYGRLAQPAVAHVLGLGKLVEPIKNKGGFRKVGVRVGRNLKMDWRLVPDAIDHLCCSCGLTPAEWFREYEEIHPFVDGNGRTGQILFNWLNGTLDKPVWAPNCWGDERRIPGAGAPEGDQG